MAPTQAATLVAEHTNNAPSISGTTAVSARILKKRETDRKCQRMIRERTKSRIAYLEALVEEFRQQDSSGRVETLMNQLSEMKEERDGLAKKVKNIENIISDGKLKEESDTRLLAISSIPAGSEEPEPMSALTIDTNRSFSSQHANLNDLPSTPSPDDISPVYQIHNKEYAAYIDHSSRSSWAASTLQLGRNHSCECTANPSALDPGVPLNKWRYANDTLTEWFKWSPQALDMQPYAAYNDDIPVRAIVEGWDAVEKRGHMHPVWRLLRGIDQIIFVSCDKRERYAVLRTMSLLLLAHLNPTSKQQTKLPSFYLKRPSQNMLHAYATEYFAWPGLRERFVFAEHRYCSGTFWRLFCKSLRIQWPYEFRDCYIHNTETGLYDISPTFHERISDIKHWTMGAEIFEQYPEFYSDFPTHNHIPASISCISKIPGPFVHAISPNNSTDGRRTSTNSGEESLENQTQLSSHLQTHLSSPTQHQRHQQVQQQPPQPPRENAVVHYHPVSAGTYNPDTLMASYNFPQSGIVESMPELQQFPAMNTWGYNNGLNMFHLHPD